ncbi:serine protein kinase RIO [Hyperthermus butylicus]|uniref:non-specific serine/threonine protein kinase n=1 Tax=Hyperthermus butylicus (strain DSM 5456 / JCM 9403 / PLM1-5) TaxID=415426 RepID=A2BML7_HYPBU|nr:serine protein kinase RIO [Hyperthermus butylicus]ABM81228.1 putative kinase [Hyperthermus butylicus DSM 5456]
MFETVEEVWDSQTLLAAYEVMRRLRIDRFAGVVSAGKEARVYRAIGRDGKEYAVKIYLTVTAEFRKSIQKYLLGDPRFEGVDISNTKKLFFAWARKEYRNLKRMWEAGVNVPRPYLVYQNIIVMEFLGRNGLRAPTLHEVKHELEPEEAEKLAWEAVDQYARIYCCARLVHADYSEYNLMLLDGKLYVIDVAQAVSLEHPNAEDFLRHDIENIYRFFHKQLGVELPEPQELLERVKQCRIQCVERKVEEETQRASRRAG